MDATITTYDERDGSHVPLIADEAQALWDESERQRAEIAARLPDENPPPRYVRAPSPKDFGWRDATYRPKDGTVFDPPRLGLPEFDCYYTGNWPEGSWWTWLMGTIWWPGDSILFRLKPKPMKTRLVSSW